MDATARMTAGSRVRSALMPVAKIGIVVVLLWYLMGSDRLRWSALQGALERPGPLVLGAALVLTNLLATAYRYWWLVRSIGGAVGRREALRICLAGNFFNMFFLGGAGGDAMRVVMTARAGLSGPDAVAAVLIDRLCGFLGLAMIAAVAVVIGSGAMASDPQLATLGLALLAVAIAITSALGGTLAAAIAGPVAAVAVIACAAAAGFLAGAWWLDQGTGLGTTRALFSLGLPPAAALAAPAMLAAAGRIKSGVGDGLRGRIAAGIIALQGYRDRPAVLATAVALSALAQLPLIAAMPCFALALRIEGIELVVHLVATPVAVLANAAPVPGGGLGVGETAYALVAERFVVVGGLATIFLTLRLWLVIFGCLGAPAWLLGHSRRPLQVGGSRVGALRSTPSGDQHETQAG